jgi:5-amino-6-(5-phosphoribosylamino)uracil reductase
VCSGSAQLDPTYRFFSQAVRRWLVTTPKGAQPWATRAASEQAASEQAASEQAAFERIITVPLTPTGLDLQDALTQLHAAGLHRLVVAGGGELVASLLAIDAIDELWLTVCPLLLGGQTAPTLVGGSGYLSNAAPRLELLSVEAIAHEVFLHYRLHRLED